MRKFFYLLLFNNLHELTDLRARLLFTEEQNLALRVELVAKNDEVRALIDAMLIGNGRQPMYSEPVLAKQVEMGSQEQLESALKSAKGRNWPNTAAALEQMVNNKANGGVRG